MSLSETQRVEVANFHQIFFCKTNHVGMSINSAVLYVSAHVWEFV